MPEKRYTALYLPPNDTFRARFFVAEQYPYYAKSVNNHGNYCVSFQYIGSEKTQRRKPEVQ